MNRKEDYLKLAVYLQNCGYDEMTLTFDQVETIIEKNCLLQPIVIMNGGQITKSSIPIVSGCR